MSCISRVRTQKEREHMKQKHSSKVSSFRESLKALEADIHHANSLAASLPGDYGGDYVQLKLSYSPLAPFIIFLAEWMDYSCTDALPTYLGLLQILVCKGYVDGSPMLSSKERRATLREFYAIIYPTLRQLENECTELEGNLKRSRGSEILSRKRGDERKKLSDSDIEKDDECGICMENSAKMVLPNCGHSLCISCFRDWNTKSQSCPFCRGSLKRVSSRDLWVVLGNGDVIDRAALAKENLRHFYLYIENLPLAVSDSHALLLDYMI